MSNEFLLNHIAKVVALIPKNSAKSLLVFIFSLFFILFNISVLSINKAVNARDLHEYLESKQEFSNWIKKRIEDYGFVENEDFVSLDKVIKREKGATKRKDYAISLDMAKELSMVERNEKGRQARKYFIEVEKIAFKELKESLTNNVTASEQKSLEPTKNTLLVHSKIHQKRLEVIEVIKTYLQHGDLVQIAKDLNVRRTSVSAVLGSKTTSKRILKALFDKSIHNKNETLFEYEEMIKQLKK